MKKEVFLSASLALMLGLSVNGFGQRDAFSIDADLYGNWTTKIKTPQGEMPLVLGIYKDPNGNDKCFWLKPKQSADTISATLEFLSKDSVAVSSDALGSLFRGSSFLGSLEGEMIQNGDTTDLYFQYVDNVKIFNEGRRRPQMPQAPFPYSTEEVVFSSADASFSGTLTLPANISGRVPVALLVSGSCCFDRDKDWFEHKPFAVIADFLARNGIATLRYDDRFFAKSSENSNEITIFDYAKDAEAGLAFLRNDSRFSKVGILGHNDGASISFIIGAKGLNDFSVALAASAIKGDELEVASYNKIGDVIDNQRSVPAKAKKMEEKYQKRLDKAKKKGIDFSDMPGFEVLNRKSEPMTVAKYREENYGKYGRSTDSHLDYDPTENISNTKCPVFALNGIKDCQVLADQNLDKIEKLVKSPKSQFKKYPDLNNLFQHCKSGLPEEYEDIEETISEEVLMDIVQWVKGL